MERPRLSVHVISETELLMMKSQGVHTAFLDCVEMLKSGNEVRCVVNQEGWGDVLHAHSYGPYYIWKGLMRKYRGRRILTVHVIPESIKGSLPAWRLLMPMARWYFKFVYSFSDVCIAISPLVEETIRSLKVKTKVVRIDNPVIAEKFRSTPRKRTAGRQLLNAPDAGFVVLGVGQIEGRKGIEDFLAVAARFPQLTFVWVGGRPFGPFTEGIHRLNRQISEAKKNNHRLIFAGTFPQKQMPLIYNAADILLFPSLQENSPLVPIEAGAASLPVIFRDLPEYARLYKHPYLKAENVEGFCSLVKKMIDDTRFYREASEISRKIVTQFDDTAIRRQLISLYREVGERKGTAA